MHPNKQIEILFLRDSNGFFVSTLYLIENGEKKVISQKDGRPKKPKTFGFWRLVNKIRNWAAPELSLRSRFGGSEWQHQLAVHDGFHYVFLEGTTFFSEWLIGNKGLALFHGKAIAGTPRKLQDHRMEGAIERLYPFIQDPESVIQINLLIASDLVIGQQDCYFGNNNTGFAQKIATICAKHYDSSELSDYREVVEKLNLEIRENGVKPFSELPEYGSDKSLRLVAKILLQPETVAALEALNSEIRQEELNLKASFWGKRIARFMVAQSTIENFNPTLGMKFANVIEVFRTAIAVFQENFRSPAFIPHEGSELRKK